MNSRRPQELDHARDALIRSAAFGWLAEQVDRYGDVLPYRVLIQGFTLEGERVPLVGPQGIFKPRIMEAPLSIMTVEASPYSDSMGSAGLRYRYRGSDPNHADNRGLRTAFRLQLPLVYFLGVGKGKYLATWPVLIVADDPEDLAVTVAVESADFGRKLLESPATYWVSTEIDDGRRRYVTGEIRQRLHQRRFRERVLDAYRRQCAFCRLRHEELLDAAHIVPDSEPEGEPVVQNGLALCKLHHAVFDRSFVGVRPDYVIEVRRDILEEHDGPTLRYAIQGLHHQKIALPRRAELWPAIGLVEQRWERFLTEGVA